MHIDENGCRHYSSVDEGRQYVDAIESMGIDDEARRHQQEGQAMTDDERGRVEAISRIENVFLRHAESGLETVPIYDLAVECYRAAMREGDAKTKPAHLDEAQAIVKLLDDAGVWQKQEGEAQAAGEVDANGCPIPRCSDCGAFHELVRPGKTQPTCLCEAYKREIEQHNETKDSRQFQQGRAIEAERDRDHWKQRAEAAESLAKVEREGRESEAVAYKKEIEGLREDVEVADAVAKMAAHDRDEALAQLTDAKATIAHWKHLACDPQTRENINAEKVAECERLRAALEKIVAHEVAYDRGEAFTATEAREALEGRTGT